MVVVAAGGRREGVDLREVGQEVGGEVGGEETCCFFQPALVGLPGRVSFTRGTKILPNFLSDYFINIFVYIDLNIISHKSGKISKHEYLLAKKCPK